MTAFRRIESNRRNALASTKIALRHQVSARCRRTGPAWQGTTGISPMTVLES